MFVVVVVIVVSVVLAAAVPLEAAAEAAAAAAVCSCRNCIKQRGSRPTVDIILIVPVAPSAILSRPVVLCSHVCCEICYSEGSASTAALYCN